MTIRPATTRPARDDVDVQQLQLQLAELRAVVETLATDVAALQARRRRTDPAEDVALLRRWPLFWAARPSPLPTSSASPPTIPNCIVCSVRPTCARSRSVCVVCISDAAVCIGCTG